MSILEIFVVGVHDVNGGLGSDGARESCDGVTSTKLALHPDTAKARAKMTDGRITHRKCNDDAQKETSTIPDVRWECDFTVGKGYSSPRSATGSSNVTRVPLPTVDSRETWPLWASITRRTNDRPRPEPVAFVVKKSSKTRSRVRGSMPGPASAIVMATACSVRCVKTSIAPVPFTASRALRRTFSIAIVSRSTSIMQGGRPGARSLRESARKA